MPKFTSTDETIKVGRFTVTLDVQHDDYQPMPWKEFDGHGIVSEWTRRAKRPGERILCEDRMSKRYYDVQATMKKARAEGWDAGPFTGTKGERAARAVERDFDRLRRFCAGDWCYVAVIVRVSRNGIELSSSCVGGIESDSGDFILETANDMIDEAIKEAKAAIHSLVN